MAAREYLFPFMVKGELQIAAADGAVLLEGAIGSAADQTLVDQAFGTVPTLYIPLYPSVKAFALHRVRILYADEANADDLNQLILYEGNQTSETPGSDKAKQDLDALSKWSSDEIATFPPVDETVLGTFLTPTALSPIALCRLQEKGKLWFTAKWNTLLINVSEANEYFTLQVWGEGWTTNW